MKTQNLNSIFSALLVAALATVSARAASTNTWVGNTDANWNTAGNWTFSSGSGPVASGDSLVFGAAGSSGLTLNNNISGLTLDKITFNSGASDFTIGGNGLTLGTGGIDASALSSGTETIGNALTLAAGYQSWKIGSGGTLAINGTVTPGTGAAVNFSSTGVASTTLANNNGIIGAWATTGNAGTSGSTGDWAAMSGSSVVAYTGYTGVAGVMANNGAANYNVTGNSTVGSATVNSVRMTADLTINSSASLYLNSGGLMLNGASKWFKAGNASSTLRVNGGQLFIDSTGSGGSGDNDWQIQVLIADNGATPLNLSKNGPGMVALTKANSYTGNTYLNAGRLGAGISSAFGTTGSLYLNGGTLDNYAAGAAVSLPNNIVVSGANNAIQLNPAQNLTLNGGISGSGSITLGNNAANSSIYLAGANTMTSGTITLVNNVNSVRFSNASAGNANVAFVFNNTTANKDTLDFNTATISFGSMTGAGTIQGNAASQTQTISAGALGLNDTFSGVIANGASAAVALTKVGAGTMTLSGANTYSGGTTVDAGTLLVDNTSGSGSVTVNNASSTLGGNGTISGAVTLNAQTVLSPGTNGTAGQTLTCSGNVTLSGVTNIFDLSTSASGANDKVAVTGTLTIGSADTITINPITASTLDTLDYTLFTATTVAGSGTPALSWGTSTPANPSRYSIVVNAASVVLHYTPPAGSPPVVGVTAFSPVSPVYVGTAVTASASLSESPGATGLTYQWQSSPNNSTWSDIGGATSATYTPSTTSAGTTYYRLHAHDSYGDGYGTGAALTVNNQPPSCAGTATPNPVNIRNNVLLTVTVTNGTSLTINSVVVNASAIGGSSSVTLVSAGGNVYTNTIYVAATTGYGNPLSLPVTVTDGNSLTGLANISLTVNGPTFVSTDTWVGNTDANWNTAANWTYSPGSGPVVSGDSLVFGLQGTSGLTLNNNISGLTIKKLTYASGADSFTFGGNNLTIGTGGIDASALSSGTETINFGITPAAGVQRWNVGSGASLALGSLPTQYGPSGGMVIISSTSYVTTTAADGWNWRGGAVADTGLVGPGFVIDNGNNTYDWASAGNSGGQIVAATYTTPANTDAHNVSVTSSTTVTPNASWASLLVNGATLTANAGGSLYLDTGIILENGGIIQGSCPLKSNNDGLYVYVPDTGTISSKIQDNGSAKLIYKAGPGTLTLSGANTYTGNTVIYEGSLIQSTAATGAGGYVVKDGASLGVSVVGGGTLKMSSLSFGNSTNTFSGIVTTSAAITNTGALTLAGTVTVNASGLIPVGQYPLIDSASIGGTGGFVVGSLASGVVANIITNGNTIVLNVTVSTPPTLLWTGLTDNNWDFATGNNWLSNAVSAIYSDGQIVRFDDSSTQTNVSIAATVSPLLLTVSNSASPYSFSGAPIAGVGSLTKSGNGTLILANANTYSGGTTISNGVLQLGDGLGNNGSVAGNITDHGKLIFANPSDQTYSGVISGTGSMIKTASGNLTLGVNNTYAGGTLLDNSPVTLPNGAVQAFGTGALTLSNATVYVKPGGGSSYNSGNSVYLGNSVLIPAGTTSTIDNSQNNYGNLWVGGDGVQWTGSGTVAIQNSTTVNSAAVLWNGNPLASFTGTLNIGATGSGTMYVGIGYNSGNGGTGASVATFDASGVAFTLDAGAGSTLCQVVDQSCTALKFGSLSASSLNTVLRGNSSSSLANQLTIEVGALNTSTTFAGKITDWGSSGTALTKVGTGTLTLSGANTYTGNTTINGGTLELAQAAPALATNSTVAIASGAFLKLTDGLVTNQVANLVTNGVAAGNGVYSSANSSGFITGSGYLQVGPVGPSGPEPIGSSYNPGTGELSLTWTSGVNWRLECQTNNLSTGLSSTGWSTVTGASDGSYTATVDPAQPTVFYRLVYP
jgi:fibronectin-binding autotransporter adhesin